MQTELISTLSAGIGASISLISVYYNNKSQFNRDKIRYQKEYDLENLRLDRQEKTNQRSTLFENIQRANSILGEFEHKVSLTQSVIDTSSKLDSKIYDINYQLETSELINLQSIAIVYLEDIVVNVTNLIGLHNVYWGHQRLLLKTDINMDNSGFISLQSQIIEISQKKNREITEIRDKISRIIEIYKNF